MADRRLDALIEEELQGKAMRAQSVPVRAAEVQLLGMDLAMEALRWWLHRAVIKDNRKFDSC